jgi:hypothetical protein
VQKMKLWASESPVILARMREETSQVGILEAGE